MANKTKPHTLKKEATKASFSFYRLIKGFEKAANLIFPLNCPGCNSTIPADGDWPLCNACVNKIEYLQGNICKQCGQITSHKDLCKSCISGKTPLPIFTIRSVAKYNGSLREAILAAKFHGREDISDRLGEPLLRLTNKMQIRDNCLIVPVPLHESKLKQRGFNLPDRLARRLARMLKQPYCPKHLKRQIKTIPQLGLSLNERLKNVTGAFSVPKGIEVSDQQILLIDDVATTGATIAAAAKPLIEKGAEVIGLTLARR